MSERRNKTDSFKFHVSLFEDAGGAFPSPLGLILTHILQTDFAREPSKTTRIAEASKISALSIRLSRSLPKMWVRIRPLRMGSRHVNSPNRRRTRLIAW